MSVIEVNTTRMTNELHTQFNQHVLELAERVGTQTLEIEALHIPYKKAFEEQLEALLIIRKSELTVKIAEQDGTRDGIFRGFVDTVKGGRNHFDPEIRNAANLLWGIFLHYGNLSRKSFNKQTAATNDMLRELERPDLQNAIDVLHVIDWVDKMSEENQKFDSLTKQRFNENAGKTTFRMKTARVKTDKFYRVLTSHLDNMIAIEGTNTVMYEFITELNVIIKKYKDILAQEFGRKNAAAKEKVKCETCEK